MISQYMGSNAENIALLTVHALEGNTFVPRISPAPVTTQTATASNSWMPTVCANLQTAFLNPPDVKPSILHGNTTDIRIGESVSAFLKPGSAISQLFVSLRAQASPGIRALASVMRCPILPSRFREQSNVEVMQNGCRAC